MRIGSGFENAKSNGGSEGGERRGRQKRGQGGVALPASLRPPSSSTRPPSRSRGGNAGCFREGAPGGKGRVKRFPHPLSLSLPVPPPAYLDVSIFGVPGCVRSAPSPHPPTPLVSCVYVCSKQQRCLRRPLSSAAAVASSLSISISLQQAAGWAGKKNRCKRALGQDCGSPYN